MRASDKLVRVARMVSAGSPQQQAFYTICDVVDMWDNKHKEWAINKLAYQLGQKKIMESYKEIKSICGDFGWAQRSMLPRVTKFIISLMKRNKTFMKGLERWNKEFGKCFINDFM